MSAKPDLSWRRCSLVLLDLNARGAARKLSYGCSMVVLICITCPVSTVLVLRTASIFTAYPVPSRTLLRTENSSLCRLSLCVTMTSKKSWGPRISINLPAGTPKPGPSQPLSLSPARTPLPARATSIFTATTSQPAIHPAPPPRRLPTLLATWSPLSPLLRLNLRGSSRHCQPRRLGHALVRIQPHRSFRQPRTPSLQNVPSAAICGHGTRTVATRVI